MKTLTKVKLINWHTFSNEEFEIYKNALITGENGTGKSTILDAIQYVLHDGKCKFNKAASDIRNRTLQSYIRCKTGIEGHEFVRNGDVTTYIALEFYDEKTEKYHPHPARRVRGFSRKSSGRYQRCSKEKRTSI